ncbi:MAG: LuxR C-terminal-related transcriptional regulator [Cyanobacteria bacterium P01_D01_bin.156]
MVPQPQPAHLTSATTTLATPVPPTQPKSPDMQAALLIAAIENFTVGLMIVARDNKILHCNKHAQTLLAEMSVQSATNLPQSLWQSCQSLLENHDTHAELFPDDTMVVLENEILTKHGTIYVRAQWFDWENDDYQSTDCFLITLENRQRSLIAMANQEAQRYGLTNRETDVWRLKRLEYSYKEIAKTLFISENTVKKHLKNVYAKKDRTPASAA